ncbi:deoxyribose-phosphate aldolase [Mesoplasma florum L1]|uniref:Deoxyribose-phosphate aldolase 1 n=2 Tax=Mesoplasma florum TaxID=2151 RepID=DEOC1_MESFL|nr:deoxyribose-phosphate aldolase [Mesoplasma florum]Q6F1Z6.1 RecName: Full=Deoxyribose-phosphate aldolase 1; Short=DERA 1; AltName: Full=2-deoxy-D-ribose 5-phosphate aldolase 1; AltName: Full=Phosphodeoxyriboaldolase 1; Short=Deoxyriboaldolase 1 [Mesoplasma florum L1]AAT75477.1 deoxyribose-phosphate aldolase [Mesoplasma florum L1]AGY41193.1 Deoxyribose-phosphate aldolase [Mesoplasma florum W37]ATI73077.1 2-deoxyribose-5-phosphate aldolase [Mesoplasma florum]ATI73766.1 2-deoxyribose-5-phosphat
MKLNKYIDHTLLKQDATKAEIKQLCDEAIEFDFATVCVNSYWTSYCKELLKGTNVGITNVVGFPLGACTTATKAFEVSEAIKDGATEIDMVLNIGALKDKNYELVLEDMKAVKKAAGSHVVKCIMENCLLTKEEIMKACEIAVEAGLEFVKTSTGFSKSGATFEDVKLMKSVVKDNALVKAAGGVRTFEDAQKMIEAGADRLGTSGGVAIIKGEENNASY